MSVSCGEMEKFGKGIGSPSRFRILQELSKGPRTVGSLAEATKQGQSCVSQHLKTLKLSNLVVDERRGKEVFYSLNAVYVLGLLKKLSKEMNGPRSRGSPGARRGKSNARAIKTLNKK